MKIPPSTSGVTGVVRGDRLQDPERTGEKGFETILRETIEKASAAPGGSTAPSAVTQAGTVSRATFPGERSPDAGLVAGRVEKFLDVFEAYQRKLGDLGVSTGSLGPIVDRLETEKEKLIPLMRSLPEGHALKEIMNRALITATVELSRFQRGDY